MPLRLGRWTLNANGVEGLLVIRGVKDNGTVDFDPNDIAQGFWDEAAQRLTVITTEVGPAAERASARAALGGVRVFTGYQFSTPQDQAPGQDLRWTLAGSFQASVAGAGASARRNVFGWFAHLTEVV